VRSKWAIVLLPVLLGTLASILAGNDYLPDPILRVRVSLSILYFLTGLLLTLIAGTGVALIEVRQSQERYYQQVQQQSAEERRRFLQRLDHELKNPLTAIRAGVVNIVEAPTNDARRDAAQSVETQAMRLSRLSADLRKLAELETRPLEFSRVDVATLLEELVALAHDKPEIEQRHLTLTLPQAPWPLPEVMGDPDLLFLAVHNLLDNAIKFTRPGNTVEVRATEDGASVVIEVADTGPGIPEEELPLVWEELYRGQSARGISGSGLGLALVKAIAERHKGQVSIRSRSGQGTVITLRLPVADATRR
jgi:two-component system, OmpR family, sensor kinase